jgi:hypothetical protein
MVARWRAAVDGLAAREGLDAGLCSVVLTEVLGRGAGGGGAAAEGQGAAAGATGRGVRGRGSGRGRAQEGVTAAEVEEEEEGEEPEGVHAFGDVEEWVKREAAAFHRMV